MNESQQTLILEIYKNFIFLNVKIFEYKYGQTAEGQLRLSLYNNICRSVLELKQKGIADLNSLFANISLVFPMLPLECMKTVDENLSRFSKQQQLDLASYTDAIFIISNMIMGISQRMTKMVDTLHMRSEKHSRLDGLECKKQVIAIFKKIRILEQTNHSKGRASAFATAYQQEIKPLLQNSDYFKANNEYDEHSGLIVEPVHAVNDRAYKSIKKLYENWKRNSTGKFNKILNLMDKHFWSGTCITPQDSIKHIDDKKVSDFVNFVNNLDEFIMAEKKNTTPLQEV